MSIKVANYGNVAVLTLKEDLVGETAEVFAQKAATLAAERRYEIVVDCSEIDGFDSHGLEVLLDLQSQCEGEFGTVKLCGLSPTCAKVLEITRLSRRFESFPDLDGAVRSFS